LHSPFVFHKTISKFVLEEKIGNSVQEASVSKQHPSPAEFCPLALCLEQGMWLEQGWAYGFVIALRDYGYGHVLVLFHSLGFLVFS